MITTLALLPGITLRCFPDSRFKQGCMSIQLVRPMDRREASLNALLPAVLLRGCRTAPDLRAITQRLDDLYGASVGVLVRRIGDYQTLGLYSSFVDERFALAGDRVLGPMVEFLGQLLLEPVTEGEGFSAAYVEGEKKNLIAAIESMKNDKRAYAVASLLRHMCREDSFGVPRLGEAEGVAPITAETAYRHYRKVLAESPIEIFYVGAAQPEQVANLLRPLFGTLSRQVSPLPAQTPFQSCGGGDYEETLDVAQGKLAMGFTTPITLRHPDFVTMQVCNTVLGGGMTGKLFQNIREKQSLCYDISSSYHGSKGIVTVCAGIDSSNKDLVIGQVEAQLASIAAGDVTDGELTAAKEALISSLRSTHDSPGAIESYYATSALSGLGLSTEEYRRRVEAVTCDQVAEAAAAVTRDTVFFLKGAQ